MNFKLYVPLAIMAIVIVLTLFLTSCGALSTLQLVVDVTEAAVPVLEAAGVPIPPQIPMYVAAVADCIGLQTGTPNAGQLGSIAACLATQIAPNVPGLPPGVAAVIGKIIDAVEKFIAANRPPLTTAKVLGPAIAPKPLKAADAMKFAMLRTRMQSASTRAKALIKK